MYDHSRRRANNPWALDMLVLLRKVENLYFEAGTERNIIKEIRETWLARRKFTGLSLPCQCHYLLSGSLGNRKTSLVKAVASNVRATIYDVSISDSPLTETDLR